MIGGGPGITPVSMSSMMDDDARLTSDREVVRRMARMLAPYKLRMFWSFVLIVVAWAASYYQTWVLSWVGQRFLYALRTRMFAHLQTLSLRYYDRESIGHIISRNTSDVTAINEVLTQGLLQSIADAFLLVGTIVLLFSMSVRLALVTMIVLPIMYFLAQWFANGSRPAYRRIRHTVSMLNAALAENIVGMKLIQAFRREERNFEEFDVANRENVKAQKRAIFYHAGIIPILDL